MKFILVFLAVALADVVWTKYIDEVGKKRPLFAALWSSAIIAMSTFTTVEYINDHAMAIPAILGAFAGTYYAVWKSLPKGESNAS